MLSILVVCGVWIALPLVAGSVALRKGWPQATVMAATSGIAMLATLPWLQFAGSTLPPQFPPSHDTQFVFAYYRWLQQVSVIYLAVALAFFWTAKAGPSAAQAAAGPLFWTMHVPLAAPVLQSSLTTATLRGTLPLEPGVTLWAWLGLLGSSLSMLALAGIAIVFLATGFSCAKSVLQKEP